jgi:Tol biopolymer transport system component
MPAEFYDLREAWLAVPAPSEAVLQDARARLFEEVALEQSEQLGQASEPSRMRGALMGPFRFARRRHSRLRLAIVIALIVLLLTGCATVTYLLVRGGGRIARSEYGRLLVVDPDGPGLHTIASCPALSVDCGIAEPAWSPDDKHIAFVRGGNDRQSLYVAATNGGGGVRRLAACGECGVGVMGHLAWSPDGKWIAFSRDAGRRASQESIWIAAAAGGRLRRLTDCRPESCADVQPGWSPDGHLLVFRRLLRTSFGRLYTVRPDGSGLTSIGDGLDPQWSPDGRRIAFDDSEGLYVANADGSYLRRLYGGTSGATGPGVPSWSPDGRKLVFLKTPGRPGRYSAEVWTINADGTGKKRLYHSHCCVELWAPPVWSPDGRMIAFSADSAGGTFVIKANGTGLRMLSPSVSTYLTWQGRPGQ